MNIYEIDNAMFSLIDEETGEIKDYEAFEELQMQREEKNRKCSTMVQEFDSREQRKSTCGTS